MTISARRPLLLRIAGAAAALLVAAIAATDPRAGSWSDVPADKVLSAVVGLHAEIPADARTARTLGTERVGSGVMIGSDGLVLTIGYLILEAEWASVVAPGGDLVSATILAYDSESGFGLLRTQRPLDVRPMELGDSSALATGHAVLSVSNRGGVRITAAKVVSRRPFAGYWEYLLDDAIFTFPPHTEYGGAALVGKDGRLLGIGSLFVSDATEEDTPRPGNMFVPVNLLKPILADLLTVGRRSEPSPPWLGLFAGEAHGRVFVARTAEDGPAQRAGLEPGDVIVGVGSERVTGLADFFRKVRARGDAGVDVPLDVLPRRSRDLQIRQIQVRSADRYDWLKLNPTR